jgi:hypothetical protein
MKLQRVWITRETSRFLSVATGLCGFGLHG